MKRKNGKFNLKFAIVAAVVVAAAVAVCGCAASVAPSVNSVSAAVPSFAKKWAPIVCLIAVVLVSIGRSVKKRLMRDESDGDGGAKTTAQSKPKIEDAQEQTAYKCSNCGANLTKLFKTKDGRQILFRDVKYRCDYCGAIFNESDVVGGVRSGGDDRTVYGSETGSRNDLFGEGRRGGSSRFYNEVEYDDGVDVEYSEYEDDDYYDYATSVDYDDDYDAFGGFYGIYDDDYDD